MKAVMGRPAPRGRVCLHAPVTPRRATPPSPARAHAPARECGRERTREPLRTHRRRHRHHAES